jgi:hypothetical protein
VHTRHSFQYFHSRQTIPITMSSNRGCSVADAYNRGLQREIQGTINISVWKIPSQRKVNSDLRSLETHGKTEDTDCVWCPNTTPGRDLQTTEDVQASYWPISLVETFGPKFQPSSFFDLLNHTKAWPEGVMIPMIYRAYHLPPCCDFWSGCGYHRKNYAGGWKSHISKAGTLTRKRTVPIW